LNNIKEALQYFHKSLASNFVLSIMAMTLAGLLIRVPANEVEGLFRLGYGLPFDGIIQVFIWSSIISALMTIFASDIWFSKIMLLWRMVILSILSVAVSIGFARVFNWIPIDNREAWIIFLGFFILGFGGGFATMIAKTKLDDKRYNKQLSDYKSKEV